MERRIIIYGTSACPYCIKAKQYFKENGIEFEDIDISTQPDKVKEMFAKSNQMGVPVLDINGQIIVGFDKDKIDAALNS